MNEMINKVMNSDKLMVEHNNKQIDKIKHELTTLSQTSHDYHVKRKQLKDLKQYNKDLLENINLYK